MLGATSMVTCHIGQKVDSIDGEMVTSLFATGSPYSWMMDACSGAGTLKFFVTIS